MPWSVERRDGEFCVVKDMTGETVTCHTSRQDAINHVRALYASESDKPNYSDSESVAYHLNQALEAEDAQEKMGHIQEALAALGEEKSEDEMDETLIEVDHGPRGDLVVIVASGEEVDLLDPIVAGAKLKEYSWQGPIVFEGIATGDNRYFKHGAITWDEESLPWAFRWQKASTKGHEGAVPIGRVDKIERREDGVIYGKGVIIPELSDEAAEYFRMMEAGVASGVSVDGDSAEFDVLEMPGSPQPRVEFSSMRLRSLTAVDIPAFDQARVGLVGDTEVIDEESEELTSRKNRKRKMQWTYKSTAYAAKTEEYGKTAPKSKDEEPKDEDEEEEEPKKKGFPFTKPKSKDEGDEDEGAEKPKKVLPFVLTAAAIPVKPFVDWFADPTFDGPMPITVTKEGAVFGHLALFDTCHIGFPGSCVTPPKNSQYKYFHTGEIETAEGDLVDVGHLTFNTGHASMQDSAGAAAAHYDNTGTVAADVRCGEDKHGIWVAGALRSTLSDEDIRMFRAAPLSGDWRRIAGKLELVGALAVNVPGFPVPRTRVRAMVASGETEALVTFTDSEEETVHSENALSTMVDEELDTFANAVFDDKKLSNEDILASDDLKVPSKSELEARAKNYTAEQVKEDLKGLRQVLDSDDESISAKLRSELEDLWDIYKKLDHTGQPRTEASLMDIELFAYDIDTDALQASGVDIQEFYNSCHDKGGKFCPTPGKAGASYKGGGGGGGHRGGGGGGSRGGGGGGHRGGGGGGRGGGGGGSRGGGGGGRSGGGGSPKIALKLKAAEQLGKYRSDRKSARNWTGIATLAFAAAAFHPLAAVAGLILPGLLANPVGLVAIGGASVVQAGKKLVSSNTARKEAKRNVDRVNIIEKNERVVDAVKAKERKDLI